MNKKKLLLTVLLTFTFLWTNVLGDEISNLLNKNTSYSIAYAKPKSSSGGFKSGSFKSSGSSSGGFKSGSFSPSSGSGSSGGFKSGSFSNTKKGTSSFGGNNSSTYSGSKTRRSFLPIPIPIPWGHGTSFGPRFFGFGYGLFSMIWGLIKFIIIMALIIYIIRRFRRR